MTALKVTPETTAHALTMLGTVAIAAEQLRAALGHKDARIAELEQLAKEWEVAARTSVEVINNIGAALNADLPADLVTAVARQRMERIAELEGAIDKLIQIPGLKFFHSMEDFKALIDVRGKKVAS